MAFGQQSGPPASAKQVQYLETLLKKAGHTGFRDARGAMGFTQRQGAGKFTKDEASTFIDQLLQTEDATGSDAPTAAERLEADQRGLVRGLPAQLLADELGRRGWAASPPRG